MIMRALCIFAVFAAASLAGCGGDDALRPKRTAYPRIAVEADTAGRVEDLAGVGLTVNRAAAFRRDSLKPGWADIEYPAPLGATIHLSVVRPQSPAEAVANRRQRMALNLGDASATAEEFHAGEWACMLVRTAQAGVATPVQLLATSADGRVLSGAAVLETPGNNADSIRPLVQLLEDDVRTLLENLR